MFRRALRASSKVRGGIFAPLAIVSFILLAVGGIDWTVSQLKARLAEAADAAVWLDSSMLADSADRRLFGVRGALQPRPGRYVPSGDVQRAVLRGPVHACRWPATDGGH
jgi:hypothetical protein